MAVHSEIHDRTAVITIDRPEVRNAVDGPTATALQAAFDDVDSDDGVDVAVLTGAAGTFCAGADLKAISAGSGNRVTELPAREIVDSDGPMGHRILRQTHPPSSQLEVAASWERSASKTVSKTATSTGTRCRTDHAVLWPKRQRRPGPTLFRSRTRA